VLWKITGLACKPPLASITTIIVGSAVFGWGPCVSTERGLKGVLSIDMFANQGTAKELRGVHHLVAFAAFCDSSASLEKNTECCECARELQGCPFRSFQASIGFGATSGCNASGFCPQPSSVSVATSYGLRMVVKANFIVPFFCPRIIRGMTSAPLSVRKPERSKRHMFCGRRDEKMTAGQKRWTASVQSSLRISTSPNSAARER